MLQISPARSDVVVERPSPSSPEPGRLSVAESGVSIVIPAYNEEGAVAEALSGLLSELDGPLAGLPVEITVVDDGSVDATAARVRDIRDPRVRLVQHQRNRGYGAAIKTGVRHASHPWILITDADGTYPSGFIPALLAETAHHDMVVGARVGAVAKIPLARRPAKWILRVMAAYLTRAEIPDLNSGLRVMRKDRLESHANLLPDGFSLTTTITLAMFSAGDRVKYVPISYLDRKGSSKIRPIADTFNFLMLILRTIAYFDPLRVFLPVAAIFFLSSIAVAVGGYYLLGRILDGTIVILFVTGVHMVGLGIVADMLSRRMRG
jgi:glycosyltransferase involved in cell wall biosynthesis